MTEERDRVLLVTGASGYLGRHLTRRAAESGIRVISGYRSQRDAISAGEPFPLDLLESGDALESRLTDLAPSAIIHTAALNPGSDRDAMMSVNVEGTRRIARIAARLDSRLVHLSSDVVHDGRHPPYDDDTPGNAIDPYGRSKAEGEAAVEEIVPAAVRVRTSLIYSLDEMDRATAGFAARLINGEPVSLFRDVIRQPVWIESLVAALLSLAFEHSELSGSFNIAGSQAISRDALARKLLEWWSVPKREEARTISAASLENPPAMDLRLRLEKAEIALGMHFEGVDEVLSAHRPRGEETVDRHETE